MKERTCPKCKAKMYSSDERKAYWTCPKCSHDQVGRETQKDPPVNTYYSER